MIKDLDGVNERDVRKACNHGDLTALKRALGDAAERVPDAIPRFQAPRMRRAHSYGISVPRRLPRSTEAMTAREMDAGIPLSHVMVDRVTVDLMGRWQREKGHGSSAPDIRRAIVACLVDVHSVDLYDGHVVTDVDSQERTVRLADCHAGGRIQPKLPFSFPMEHGTARFDGMRLTCGSVLPETALQALPGRRVRDLMITGTALDRRIITEAVDRGSRGAMYIGVEADDMPLEEVT